MVRATKRPSEKGDGLRMAKTLRLADRREIIAFTGESPREGVERALEDSDECWTYVLDDEPIAMCGLLNDGDGSANIWMLGSYKIKDVKMQFLRDAQEHFDTLMEKYTRVWAFADVRNRVHQKWYEWMGFKILTMVHTGPFNLPFYHIEYNKEI